MKRSESVRTGRTGRERQRAWERKTPSRCEYRARARTATSNNANVVGPPLTLAGVHKVSARLQVQQRRGIAEILLGLMKWRWRRRARRQRRLCIARGASRVSRLRTQATANVRPSGGRQAARAARLANQFSMHQRCDASNKSDSLAAPSPQPAGVANGALDRSPNGTHKFARQIALAA